MKSANLVLYSSAIFDSVHDAPFSGGIAISRDKIVCVGLREEIERYVGPGTEMRDFGDKLIMPGICDGHAHLAGTANKQYAEVAGGLEKYKSEDECVKAVKAFAAAHPELKRIYGTGWLLPNWGYNPRKPTKASLDAAFPDIPVYLQGTDGHSFWLNSKAIDECGLDEIVRQNPDAPPELAPRDENGGFAGFLAEKICFIVNMFAASSVYTAEKTAEYQTRVVKELNSYGLTGFTDVSPIPAQAITNYLWPLKALENAGRLTLRIYLWAGDGPAKDGSIEDAKRIRILEEYINSDKLRIAGLKTFIDGIPFGHTAAMLEPYADNPGIRGEFLYPPEAYDRWVTAVNKMGYAVKVHCCGDAAVRLALDCFEKSNAANGNMILRNSVEHLDIVSLKDIPRFKELGVIASVQPSHVVMGKGIYSTRIGERSKLEWNFRKLREAGARFSIGTDSPVVDFNPFETIYKAVTRKDIDGTVCSPYTQGEEMTLTEALKGYTVGSAYASNMESKVGTLEAGKYADIIILDRNLFATPADGIKDSRAVCTIFEGQIVYEAL